MTLIIELDRERLNDIKPVRIVYDALGGNANSQLRLMGNFIKGENGEYLTAEAGTAYLMDNFSFNEIRAAFDAFWKATKENAVNPTNGGNSDAP